MIASKAGRIDEPLDQPEGRIYVSVLMSLQLLLLTVFPVWYTSWRNRGYLSKESILRMPVVEDRWRQLSEELPKWKEQGFDIKKKR